MQIEFTRDILIGMGVGIVIGFILGFAFSKVLSKTSLIPLWNTIAVLVFVFVNVYSVLTGAEVPQIFQFTMALIVGTVSGIDLVKYIPMLSQLGKK